MNPAITKRIPWRLSCITTLCFLGLAGCSAVEVPTVVGLTQSEAVLAIMDAGLIVGTVTEAYSDSVAEGAVISQSPPGGMSIASGSVVDLNISLGVEPVSVPSVVGVFEINAEILLANAGLTVGTVVKHFSKVMPAGNVLSQFPAADALVPPGSAVDLILSLGSDGINISSIAQLQLIGIVPNYGLDGNYVLTNDIDAAMTEEWKADGGFIPIGGIDTPFSGSFDGQGFTISNLHIHYPVKNRVGLFGYTLSTSEIRNVVLEAVDITGLDWVGAIVGSNSGVISNCHVEGTITGRLYTGGLSGFNLGSITDACAVIDVTGFSNVGGLVGFLHSDGSIESSCAEGVVTSTTDYAGGLAGASSGEIVACRASVDVSGNKFTGGLAGYCSSSDSLVEESYATGSVSGTESVGGLVGFMSAFTSTANRCYATGPVTGEEAVGGLVGTNYGDISECYSTGSVNGDAKVGGLVGDGGAPVLTSFWDTESSGVNTSAGGAGAQGRTTAAMMEESTFTGAGWDFEAVWYMLPEGSYPYLQSVPGVLP